MARRITSLKAFVREKPIKLELVMPGKKAYLFAMEAKKQLFSRADIPDIGSAYYSRTFCLVEIELPPFKASEFYSFLSGFCRRYNMPLR